MPQSRRTPLIPLGSAGRWAGGDLGSDRIPDPPAVEEDGITYEWEEYLLFNPYKGFRYLTNFQGHWNFVSPRGVTTGTPRIGSRGRRFLPSRPPRIGISPAPQATDQSSCSGNFRGASKSAKKCVADDFVHPPLVLSSETTDDEVTWSQGEYTQGADLWKAFALARQRAATAGDLSRTNRRPNREVGGIWAVRAVADVLCS